MSKATLKIEGFLAEPRSSVKRDGGQVLNLSVGHTPRRKNKQTNEWEDAGPTIWVQAAFFDEQAEFLATQVGKGVLVQLEGEPQLRVWESNGKSGVNLELKFAQVAVIPRPQSGQGGQGGSTGGFGGGNSSTGGNGSQTGGQEWASPGAEYDGPAPF